MEAYNQHIELINSYLNNLLSKEARLDFESKLQNDIEFKTLYEEHVVFVNGLKRVQLKADIQKGKQSYKIEKWLKISGLSIIAIGALVMIYTLVFNTTSEIESIPNNNNHSNTIVVDSTSNEKITSEIVEDTSEVKIDVVKNEVETESENLAKRTSVKNSFNKPAQIISLNSEKDTIINCKEGTILHIKKESFVNPKTGQLITGIIDLKVTEYYKLSDILMANLSTVSNRKQLETGGMLNIEAKQNATKLNLKENASIQIQFPTKNKKPDMQLFSGEWNDETINWTLQNDELENLEVAISEEEIDEHIEVPFAVVDQIPTFPGCETDDDQLRRQCTIDAISKFVTKNFNTDIAYDLGLKGKQRITSVFKIDQKGNIISIRSRATDSRLSEEADRVLGLLPKMVPGMQRGRPVTVPYSLPIFLNVDDNTIKQRLEANLITGVITSSDDVDVIGLWNNQRRTFEMDTIYNNRRGIVEIIREIMHDKDFIVDSVFMSKWDLYKKQNHIRNISIHLKNNVLERAVILRKPLFEMEDTRFKIFEDDSITRGGHVIRIPWDETQIPTTTQVMNIVPKRIFYAGNDAITAEEFEERLSDSTERSISSRDVGYYVLKTSSLGWINCDRFINGRIKRIKYKLKIKNADGANINMVFKSLNSVLPSRYSNGIYDFKEVGANEDVTLVAIKRKGGKLFYDTLETKTKENPQLNFDFKEISLENLKKELEKLNSTFK